MSKDNREGCMQRTEAPEALAQLTLPRKYLFVTQMPQEFQKSKVFKRIVTSVMFDELIETYRSIYSRSSLDIIQNLIKPLEEDINILQNYTLKNGKSIRDNQLLDSMIAIAKEYNTSLAEIIQINNLKNPNNIEVGQIIEIPNPETKIVNHSILTPENINEKIEK